MSYPVSGDLLKFNRDLGAYKDFERIDDMLWRQKPDFLVKKNDLALVIESPQRYLRVLANHRLGYVNLIPVENGYYLPINRITSVFHDG